MKILYLGAGLAAFLLTAMPLSAQTLTVSPSDCLAVVAHTPADDVAYKPGVDVHGNDVASADLNSSGTLNFAADHEFWLPIEIPLEDVLSIGASDTLDAIRESKIGVGAVTLKNGQVFFNGKPLGDANSNAIAAACAKQQAAASG